MSKGPINIAIDGFSACGKSTLAKDLAACLGYIHIDSGSMYRALTAFFIDQNINYSDPEILETVLEAVTLRFSLHNSRSQLLLNEVYQDENLRTTQVDALVSEIAALEMVRVKIVKQQQAIGKLKGIVMDGRDIGSVVFPDAELKIFLQADLAIRVTRRLDDLLIRGIKTSEAAVLLNLQKRDHTDATRLHSPLIKSADAILIDNSNLSPLEQLKMLQALAKCRINQETN